MRARIAAFAAAPISVAAGMYFLSGREVDTAALPEFHLTLDDASNDGRTERGDRIYLLYAAQAAYRSGDLDAAKERLAEALRAGDRLADAWSLRARMALDENDVETAKAAIMRAREAGAAPRSVFLLEAEALMRSGDAALARATLAKAGKRGTVDPQKDYVAALIEAAEADYVASARALRGARGAFSDAPNIGLVAGLVFEGAGDVAQAEAELRRNLVLTPRKAVLYDALASLLIRQNRIEEAEPIVERLEALSSAGGAVRRVQLLLRCGEYDAALNGAKAAPEGSPVFAAFLAFGPHSAAARRERADVVTANALIAGGRALIDADDRAIRRAIETLRKSDEPAALALAGELALAIDDDDGARGFFDRALKAFPDLSAALVGRLRVDVRADDFAAAEGWLKGIIERDTDNLAALTALARVLVAQGRLDEARERLRPVSGNLAASPDDARLFAALLLSRGEVDALGAFADEARRLRPADPETAALFAEAGRFAEAAHVARAALLEAPSEERRALYRAQMERQGRAAEAAAFLKALAARTGDDAGFSPQAPRKAAGESVREARIAYLTAPGDPAAASRFGAALAASGNEEGASRVLREASFWALEEKYLSRAGKS